MRECKIYSTDKKAEANAVIVDRLVLMPVPRRHDINPSYIADDGQCYYPPCHAAAFTNGLYGDLVPFSIECEWSEFMDFSDETKKPMPEWVAIFVNELDDLEGYIYISAEKWGYCDAKSGEIKVAPQFEWCGDFDDEGYAVFMGNHLYGVFNINNYVAVQPLYHGLLKQKAGYGVFFYTDWRGKWGAFDADEDGFDGYYGVEDVVARWDGIWWDGYGGYTVMEKKDGREIYSILNAGCSNPVVTDLTENPVRYEPTANKARETSYRHGGGCHKFRIIQKEEKYGLICDGDISSWWYGDVEYSTRYSELLLEPVYSCEFVQKFADKTDMDGEIDHYARFIRSFCMKTGCEDDGWNHVPGDLREAVRDYMKGNGFW